MRTERFTRPFTDAERHYLEINLAPLPRLTPQGALLRWFLCVGVCSALALAVALKLFGDGRTVVALALLVGGAVGDALSRAWTSAALRAQAENVARWERMSAKWQTCLDGGVMEVLRADVLRVAVMESDFSEPVYFVQIGEREVLCVWDADGEPCERVEIGFFPGLDEAGWVTFSGPTHEPDITLTPEDFVGFSNPESVFAWLRHGKLYPTTLDDLTNDLISL